MVTTLQLTAYRTRGHIVYMSDTIEIEINGAINLRALTEAAQKTIGEAAERYNAAREGRKRRERTNEPAASA